MPSAGSTLSLGDVPGGWGAQWTAGEFCIVHVVLKFRRLCGKIYIVTLAEVLSAHKLALGQRISCVVHMCWRRAAIRYQHSSLELHVQARQR